jgi:hypothetical protein
VYEFEEIANIAMICFLLGVGVAVFIGIVFAYLAVCEFFEMFYTEGWDD